MNISGLGDKPIYQPRGSVAKRDSGATINTNDGFQKQEVNEQPLINGGDAPKKSWSSGMAIKSYIATGLILAGTTALGAAAGFLGGPVAGVMGATVGGVAGASLGLTQKKGKMSKTAIAAGIGITAGALAAGAVTGVAAGVVGGVAGAVAGVVVIGSIIAGAMSNLRF